MPASTLRSLQTSHMHCARHCMPMCGDAHLGNRQDVVCQDLRHLRKEGSSLRAQGLNSLCDGLRLLRPLTGRAAKRSVEEAHDLGHVARRERPPRWPQSARPGPLAFLHAGTGIVKRRQAQANAACLVGQPALQLLSVKKSMRAGIGMQPLHTYVSQLNRTAQTGTPAAPLSRDPLESAGP